MAWTTYLDHVNIELLAWDEVKSKLAVAGVLRNPEGIIPPSQIDLFKKDSDFLGSLVWEGEYRALLNVLAQHELRLPLIGGLNRQDVGHYMQIAFLMAMLDVLDSSATTDTLRVNIETQAKICYGVPLDYKHTNHFVDGLLTLVNQIDNREWPNITGPQWVTENVGPPLLIPLLNMRMGTYRLMATLSS